MTVTCVHLIFIIKKLFIYDNNHGGWALLSEPDNCVNFKFFVDVRAEGTFIAKNYFIATDAKCVNDIFRSFF
jgi:hypothetical protein